MVLARYTAAGVVIGLYAIWGKYSFVDEATATPSVDVPVHSYKVPLALTLGYLVSLPLLKRLVVNFISKEMDMKTILWEAMVLYNLGQVILNAWMVYRFVLALYQGHPFIGDFSTTKYGTSYVIWIHYCDKYLEFLDTYFMVLRGKFDQVSFLHIYHHATIAWAWWAGMCLYPDGDAYFGALFNSWIHVLMYSYYTMSLLHIQCPWKKFLTMAQMIQFISVIVYSVASLVIGQQKVYDPSRILAYVVQVGEMASLFILFSQFYKKSYGKKKKNEADNSNNVKDAARPPVRTESNGNVKDECHEAIKNIAATASDVVENAAKDANKIVSSLSKNNVAASARVPS